MCVSVTSLSLSLSLSLFHSRLCWKRDWLRLGSIVTRHTPLHPLVCSCLCASDSIGIPKTNGTRSPRICYRWIFRQYFSSRPALKCRWHVEQPRREKAGRINEILKIRWSFETRSVCLLEPFLSLSLSLSLFLYFSFLFEVLRRMKTESFSSTKHLLFVFLCAGLESLATHMVLVFCSKTNLLSPSIGMFSSDNFEKSEIFPVAQSLCIHIERLWHLSKKGASIFSIMCRVILVRLVLNRASIIRSFLVGWKKFLGRRIHSLHYGKKRRIFFFCKTETANMYSRILKHFSTTLIRWTARRLTVIWTKLEVNFDRVGVEIKISDKEERINLTRIRGYCLRFKSELRITCDSFTRPARMVFPFFSFFFFLWTLREPFSSDAGQMYLKPLSGET